VFPAEGLYGLGADAMSPSAVAKLVAVRGREDGKPILVLVADVEMAASVAREVTPAVRRLAARFWPGPLTLVLPARDGLPPALTAGTGTIGVRVPGATVARELARELGRPVTAPSANPPGELPPRTVDVARGYFADRVAVYVDGGALDGRGSTVAAVDADGVRVLREGPISRQAIEEAV